MFNETITTLLPALPSMDAASRPYAPVHYDRQALLKLAQRRMPFWVKMDVNNVVGTSQPPTEQAFYHLRYPGVKFDLEVWGAATNLDLSQLKLVVSGEQVTDRQIPVGAMAGAVTEQRRIWRWETPLLVRAHTPLRLQIFYNAQAGGLVNNTGWVVLHGVRLEKSGWMSRS